MHHHQMFDLACQWSIWACHIEHQQSIWRLPVASFRKSFKTVQRPVLIGCNRLNGHSNNSRDINGLYWYNKLYAKKPVWIGLNWLHRPQKTGPRWFSSVPSISGPIISQPAHPKPAQWPPSPHPTTTTSNTSGAEHRSSLVVKVKSPKGRAGYREVHEAQSSSWPLANIYANLFKLIPGKSMALPSPHLALTSDDHRCHHASLTTTTTDGHATMTDEHEATTTTTDDPSHDHGQRRTATDTNLPPTMTTMHYNVNGLPQCEDEMMDNGAHDQTTTTTLDQHNTTTLPRLEQVTMTQHVPR
ncbi:uncharacterized protein LACBIDRAFT_321582 [Laccaria bicolor S238N-H82]|uniref:Predicted protein n=1 Tax=Laccaria bicolor (strain S238N-H82 / ATCC MYA-4686) TaxID=486041 RepID=B0CTF6_LACBS|nr:uncharacterized protein LACBIDRAFT_321582 [Laccaria bicolor S238N-H82]EDR13911.1 predicted protein [Laccaria bicolor S238N-H82]|eukprot:XP_001874470.1 predicted protein [Laccaria bicolor S238N-H82]